MNLKENVNVFNQDIKEGETYKYTAEGLSKNFSNSYRVLPFLSASHQ
jgi:hypothetical protein